LHLILSLISELVKISAFSGSNSTTSIFLIEVALGVFLGELGIVVTYGKKGLLSVLNQLLFSPPLLLRCGLLKPQKDLAVIMSVFILDGLTLLLLSSQ
jgi:hypothetical protein